MPGIGQQPPEQSAYTRGHPPKDCPPWCQAEYQSKKLMDAHVMIKRDAFTVVSTIMGAQCIWNDILHNNPQVTGAMASGSLNIIRSRYTHYCRTHQPNCSRDLSDGHCNQKGLQDLTPNAATIHSASIGDGIHMRTSSKRIMILSNVPSP